MAWKPWRDIDEAWDDFLEQSEEATGLDLSYYNTENRGQNQSVRRGIENIQWVLDILGLSEPELTRDNVWWGVHYQGLRKGFPYQLRREVFASGSTPPTGVLFVGHASECMFDSLQVTMSGVSLVDDPAQKAGVGVRLIQRDENGETIYVSGLESLFGEDDVVVREELIIPAKSPLTASESFGGPITESLPMFLVVRPVGDWAAVSGFADLSVQIAVNLLCRPTT